MPRVSRAHEEAIRQRIVEAAVGVFATKGYHGATMQDVARASGLSIGAIYTWFGSKDELFLAGCDLTNGFGLGELADRIVRGRSVVEKLAIAVGFYLDAIDDPHGGPGMASVLVAQWGRAEADPAVREMLQRRREQLAVAGGMLVREGIATGELPVWLDADALAQAYIHLLDGLLLWRLEQGPAYRRDDAERRAFAMLAPLVAAASVREAPVIDPPAPRPWSVLDPSRTGERRAG